MVPWLVINGICMVVGVCFGSCTLFFYPRVVIPVYIASSALNFYCYLAVYSLYESIIDKSQRGLVTNVRNAGSLITTTNDIPNVTQCELA